MLDLKRLSRVVAAVTIIVVSVLLAIYILYLLRKPISWIAFAAFLAIALSAPVNVLNRRMPRGRAIAITYVILLLIPALLLAALVPPIVREGSNFVAAAPDYATKVQKWVNNNRSLRNIDEKYRVADKLQKEAEKLPNKIGDAAQVFGDVGLRLVNSAFATITILILSVFIVANGRRWTDAFLLRYYPSNAPAIRETLDRMATAVAGYVAGALLQSFVAGVTTFIVLTILGVPFAAPLGVVVALFDLIPMVGATIAAVIVAVVTVFSDFPLDTIIWVVWAIAYQQVENTLIQPRIQSRTVGVHPFLVIVSVIFGGTLLGIPGALLAVPLAAMIQIGIRDWGRWRILEGGV